MRNAFLLITNTIGHAEEEWNTKVPPRGHQISKDTTLRPRKAKGYPLRHWQPKVETSKSREGALVHQQGTQERLRSSETTGEHYRPIGEETSEEREAQTQRIQPFPEGQNVGRHEHGRRCQGVEGERGRIVLHFILHETARSRLAVPISAILAKGISVEEQRRGESSQRPRQPLFRFRIVLRLCPAVRKNKGGGVV